MLTASLRPAGAKLGTKRPRMTENGEVLVARQQKMKLHSSQDLLQVAQRGQPGSLGARSVMLHGVHQHASFCAVSTAKREQAWGTALPDQQLPDASTHARCDLVECCSTGRDPSGA